ncbi:hypothetical protein GCM10010116_54050 [Microbispora rosea subsp. aerata]|nr:hypothetical protein GCM10010116_54050 [Microbispora rosea subsp. aerata]
MKFCTPCHIIPAICATPSPSRGVRVPPRRDRPFAARAGRVSPRCAPNSRNVWPRQALAINGYGASIASPTTDPAPGSHTHMEDPGWHGRLTG